MPSLIVDLVISAHDYKAHYTGAAKNVVATAKDGTVIRFPSNCLRQVVTEEGIIGTFEISFDDDFRFVGITRIK